MSDTNPETLYGFGSGDHIALIKKIDYDVEKLNEVLLGFSCYPPALPKINNHLKSNGRYECVVQYSWFRGQYSELKRLLGELGVDLEVISMCIRSRIPLK